MWIDTGPLRNALATLGSELPPTRPVWYVSGLLIGLPLALTERETEVLRLVAAGQSNAEIAGSSTSARPR